MNRPPGRLTDITEEKIVNVPVVLLAGVGDVRTHCFFATLIQTFDLTVVG